MVNFPGSCDKLFTKLVKTHDSNLDLNIVMSGFIFIHNIATKKIYRLRYTGYGESREI